MAKILVTGATGTVGSHVLQQFAAKGVSVRAAVHSPKKAVPAGNAEFVGMDFDRKDTIVAALAGIEKVFLLTPFTENLAELSARVVDAAKNAGVRHIVKLSAVGAEAEAISVARWQRAAERHLEASGIPFTHLRPNFFAQNFLTYHRSSIASEGKIYMPVGDGKAAYIDARDIASAAVSILLGSGHEGKAYTLTGPAAVSTAEVAATLARALGRPVEHVNVPEEAAAEAMRGMGAPEWMIKSTAELNTVIRKGYAAGITDTVNTLTGSPPRTMEQFVRDHVAQFK